MLFLDQLAGLGLRKHEAVQELKEALVEMKLPSSFPHNFEWDIRALAPHSLSYLNPKNMTVTTLRVHCNNTLEITFPAHLDAPSTGQGTS